MTDHQEILDGQVEFWTKFVQGTWSRHERSSAQSAGLLLPYLELEELADTQRYPSPSVLEVGCGSGRSAAQALAYLPARVKYIATDITPAMLEAAAKVLPKDIVTLQIENAMQLSFPDGQFERYWSNYCIHLVPDPVAQAKEAYRVLKDDGIATFCFWGRPENSPFFTHMNTVLQSLGITPPPPRHDNFALGRDLSGQTRQMFLDAGFKQVLVFFASAGLPARTGADFWEYANTSAVPPERMEEVKRAFIASYDEEASKGHAVGRHEVALVVCYK